MRNLHGNGAGQAGSWRRASRKTRLVEIPAEAGLALFTLATAACALSPTAAILIAARAVQGAGGGVATPVSLVLITEAFPVQRRGAVVGMWGAITGIAVGFGPVIGGAIVQGLAWQWVFWLNVPIGVVLVTAGGRLLAESRGPARRLDPLGLVLATGAIFTLTDALLRGGYASRCHGQGGC